MSAPAKKKQAPLSPPIGRQFKPSSSVRNILIVTRWVRHACCYTEGACSQAPYRAIKQITTRHGANLAQSPQRAVLYLAQATWSRLEPAGGRHGALVYEIVWWHKVETSSILHVDHPLTLVYRATGFILRAALWLSSLVRKTSRVVGRRIIALSAQD